jgi:hypothetical protein
MTLSKELQYIDSLREEIKDKNLMIERLQRKLDKNCEALQIQLFKMTNTAIEQKTKIIEANKILKEEIWDVTDKEAIKRLRQILCVEKSKGDKK